MKPEGIIIKYNKPGTEKTNVIFYLFFLFCDKLAWNFLCSQVWPWSSHLCLWSARIIGKHHCRCTGDQSQGDTNAKQALYQLSYVPAPFGYLPNKLTSYSAHIDSSSLCIPTSGYLPYHLLRFPHIAVTLYLVTTGARTQVFGLLLCDCAWSWYFLQQDMMSLRRILVHIPGPWSLRFVKPFLTSFPSVTWESALPALGPFCKH